MRIDEELFTFSEKLVLELKQLYRSCGYQPYRMSKFEEYDLYAEYKDFLYRIRSSPLPIPTAS